MKRGQSVVLSLLLFAMVAPVSATVTLYTDELAWQGQVAGLEQFITISSNVGKADELSAAPGNDADCGPVLTFSTSKTGLSRGFAVETLQPGATFVFNNSWGGPSDPPIPGMVNALSVGNYATTPLDVYENDDWRLQITSGPALRAFAFRLGENDRNAGETFTVLGLSGDVLGTFSTPTSPYSYAFMGVISDYPIGSVTFDEAIDADHISISDFQFAVPEPGTLSLLAVGGLMALRRKTR